MEAPKGRPHGRTTTKLANSRSVVGKHILVERIVKTEGEALSLFAQFEQAHWAKHH